MEPMLTTGPPPVRRRRKRGASSPPLSAIASTVQGYIDGVLDGTILAGELIRLAAQRHVDDLREGPSRGLRFDPVKAEESVEFFSYLKHSKGEWAGQAFTLEPWQMFLIWALFGWLRADGTRRFRTAYVEIPRKNGKSTLGAGIGLKLAFADGESGAEVFSAATKLDQAIIVHSEATRMVRATPALADKITINKNNLSRFDTYQKYEPLGADEDTLDGLNVHGAIVDELHAHKTRGVFDLMETGTSARRQPLLFAITTAGTDQSATSICWEQHVYAEQILRKIIADDTYFAFIACMDEARTVSHDFQSGVQRVQEVCSCGLLTATTNWSEGCSADSAMRPLVYSEILNLVSAAHSPTCASRRLRVNGAALLEDVPADDWQDERSWYKANPNLGVSKKIDYMRDQARKSKNMPAKLNTFLRLDLDQWTQQSTRWIDMLLWDENAGPPIDEETLRGRLCYGGLDLSSVSDLTAWVLVFPDPVVPDRITILPRIWCPEARLQDDQRNQYRDQYQAWARDGWILTTPGNAIDYDQIKAQILEDAQNFQVQEVAVDRLFQGYQLSMQLADEGLTVAACGMGFMSMAGPCKEFERRLLGHQLHHGGHPVLKWMANNVAVREDPAGNLKPDKALSLDTPLPTPWGWTTMRDVQPSDMLFDEQGQPCRVIGVSDVRDDRPCYAVTFSDGERIVADAGHEWLVHDTRLKVVVAMTTAQMAEAGVQFRIQRRFSVRLSQPLELPSQDLILDPYLLGVWLGDGHTGSGKFTTMDEEIVQAFREQFDVIASRQQIDSKAISYTATGLTRSLWELGIYGRKRIPDVYLRASRSQRLALLQGLMDSDGSVTKPSGRNGGYCCFVNTNHNLAQGVHELAASLGLKPVLFYARGPIGPHAEVWKVSFVAYSTTPVFRLPHKLARMLAPPDRQTRTHTRQIVSIEPVPSVPVRCVTVDSPSHLYLAGRSMIPTHNSTSQGKIDGIIGILLALDRAMRHTTTTSVYESRGLLTLGGSSNADPSTA